MTVGTRIETSWEMSKGRRAPAFSLAAQARGPHWLLGSRPEAFRAQVEVLKAINTMLKMGASMDSAALKSGALAHSQAIANMDSKGVATLADYTAINAAIGKDVGPYMMSKVDAADAKAAYQALMDFKDVVKASQR
eukprot:s7678_g4.t1